MKSIRQTTLGSSVTVTGVGVHSGMPVTVGLGPADTDAGYLFIRTGLDGADREIRANADAVIATEFATVLGDAAGPLVSTAEHVLAALRGMGVDNATIEIDGPEVPIVDGSAAPFVDAIEQAGIIDIAAPRRFIEVLKPVRVVIGQSVGEFLPYADGFRADVEIDFAHPQIGRQAFSFELSAASFRRDVCRARTFGCMDDTAKLWAAGYARGASLENTVVYDDKRVLNPEGLRYRDEFVRHKVLDVVGDLALAGLPLLGRYNAVRPGHKLNNAVLRALLADCSAWRIVEAAPARRRRGHADVAGAVAAAYSPEVS
jgi:UDP-3-O-[3-hydroxymyristoyl] N-acetylglucosamine deacetylase